jgi:hypothetical protein
MAAFFATYALVFLVAYVVMIIGMWKMFEKAGRPGWQSIVPIYNWWVLAEMAGKPGWWSLLLFVPIANIVVQVIISIELSKAFGKDPVYAVLLIFLPYVAYLMLGFGDAKYTAPAVNAGTSGTPKPPATA